VYKISIQSPEPDSRLERECEALFLQLKGALDEGTIEPTLRDGVSSHRGALETFRQLVVQGVGLGVFAAMFEVLKTWLSERPSYEVEIDLGDGVVIKAKKVTLDEAMRLIDEAAQRRAAAQT
jgi:hypothetical protein